jgi:single-stranded-DNA-specific exonuclease
LGEKMKFRWSLAPPQPLLAGQLAGALGISPLLAQCLLNRGLGDPAAIDGFLQPRLKHLSDPFLLPNMAAAVDRLFLARQNREPLVIFGDYDVDGVTSTALLLEFLGALGWTVQSYLPHRMEEGYGLSQEAVENCLKKFPVKLFLAVDCGSNSVQSIAWLKDRGVEVIVLDHHQVSSPAPEALAIVNPQLLDSTLKHNLACLCSVGLAFKLAHALLKRAREAGMSGAAQFDLRPLLDLVALGTIADLVPLVGENRILASTGLERLNTTSRPGLVALKQVARTLGPLGAYEVGFHIAPRLNAAGRLEAAQEALQLLLASDLAQATSIASNLDKHNRDRQVIERAISEEAISLVRAKFKPESHFVIVEGQLPWHIGVVGIVASRVLQHFYRPTIIVGGDGVEWRGSGRSIAGFDLAAALRQCSDLLVRHGGHAMAAGVTLHSSKLDTFRARLNQLAADSLTADQMQAPLRLDAEVGLEEMTLDCLTALEALHPTGQGNPNTQFFARNLGQNRPAQRMGAEKQHLKLWVTDGGPITHEAVWWGAASQSLPAGKFDLAFAPQLNHYNGRTSVQLKILDWRPSGAS